ncbi:MAG: hypothetical protein M1827_007743 [Pycnora praestabilis]|nr:MAG: hypothetical protein M1827_007743 [Pycnora praestabilis]
MGVSSSSIMRAGEVSDVPLLAEVKLKRHVFKADQPITFPNVDLLSWTFGNLDYDQDKPIYVDAANPARTLSAREARTVVRKLIAGLKAEGLQPGDCVCIHAFNDIFYSLIFLAIIGAGGCFAGSNPGYTSQELAHHMKTTKTRFVITDPTKLSNIQTAAQECGIQETNIYIFNPLDQHLPHGSVIFKGWEEFMRHGECDWIRFDDEQKAHSTTAVLLSTSGTTGLPKSAMISHQHCVVQSIILREGKQKPYEISRLVCLPEFHAFAVPIAHVVPLRGGITTYVMPRFEMSCFMQTIERFQITETLMVPPMMTGILKSPLSKEYSLKSLRFVSCGGAPLEGSLQHQFYTLLAPDALLTQVWGMTETGWLTTFQYPEKDDTGSVGRLLPTIEARLLGDDGNDISEDDQRGEVLVRSPHLLLGYLGNPSATAATFDAEGWLNTGDIGVCNKGKWYMVDRKKELIKVRGWQVAPTELETVLLDHAHIIDAAVIGINLPDSLGEVPRAYVVMKPGYENTMTEKEVNAFMLTHLARYKSLDGGVRFVATIPKSPSGKILKKILRSEATAERAIEVAKEVIEVQKERIEVAKHDIEVVERAIDAEMLSENPIVG